ncbi:protein of unknown function [Streptomyces sp. KY75]|nr:protein of unknown function [Streptomyces sp. KY75]CAD5986811.1 protein of unknown function [Streptomyces sp. KY70]
MALIPHPGGRSARVRARTACQGLRRGANHLIRASHRRYLPVDSMHVERSSLKLVLD